MTSYVTAPDVAIHLAQSRVAVRAEHRILAPTLRGSHGGSRTVHFGSWARLSRPVRPGEIHLRSWARLLLPRTARVRGHPGARIRQRPQMTPIASIASATWVKPLMLAPAT